MFTIVHSKNIFTMGQRVIILVLRQLNCYLLYAYRPAIVILNEVKNLVFGLRTSSVKHLGGAAHQVRDPSLSAQDDIQIRNLDTKSN